MSMKEVALNSAEVISRHHLEREREGGGRWWGR